jgi:hypothetical protein
MANMMKRSRYDKMFHFISYFVFLDLKRLFSNMVLTHRSISFVDIISLSQWDHKRILTPLGRKQADLTGRRIAEMIKGVDETFRPCNVKILRVSNMARARETADIIATHIPDVERAEPDPLLNEGW